ncbi:hypothetical protein ACEPAH_3484 [Sanghuangporus vaninii]
MPLITVDDQGHQLYYEDTGPPPNGPVPYTALFIIHGTAFHGQIFKRLLPLAANHNLRLVVVNRRDYPGSSPYTEEELDVIRKDNETGNDGFGRGQAAELAQFIRTFIEKEHIPKPALKYRDGGIVLLSWSSGNGYTLPLLAYADSIPESTREVIEPYLRLHIIFDAPRWILGVPPLEQQANPLKLTSLSEDECIRIFANSVTAYYKHKNLISRNLHDLQFEIPVDGRKSMSLEEVRQTTCHSAIAHSEAPIQTANTAIYANRLRHALFDDTTAKYWLRCRVDVVWCEHSPWESIDVMWNLQLMREKADREGITGRPMRFVMMPGANHFPHWDQPDVTMKFFDGVLHA